MAQIESIDEQAALSAACRICGSALDAPRLRLGDLPPCNRFEPVARKIETHPLTLAGCKACGFIQLIAPMPIEMVTPRVPWIRYNEPEGHLDDLVERTIAALGGPAKLAFGAGPFEQPLHTRLTARGVASEIAIAPPPPAYLETWQHGIESGDLASSRSADIVSCRYILEHCHDPRLALRQLAALSAPGGLLLIEVPDSAKFLKAGDYAFPWEEHISYFTEESLLGLSEAAGFKVEALFRYPGQLEDALIVLLRSTDVARAPGKRSPDLFSSYRDGFAPLKARVRRKVEALAGPDRDRIALFGVGHQAIMFANALEIADLIGLVVDDDVDKRGTVAPGFARPIVGSADLLADQNIQTCLLAVAPRAEPKVRNLLNPLAERGAAFYSIFAGVPGSILAD